MTLKIEVDIDNDAFHMGHNELGRILARISEQAMEIEGECPMRKERDVNGNTVARWSIDAR